MDMNWFVTEFLIRHQQMEIERSARHAWKWHQPKQQKLLERHSMKRQLPAASNACCNTCG